MAYAVGTAVAEDATRLEIERTLRRYGADRFGYMSGPDGATVAFEMRERRYAFKLPMPDKTDQRFTHTKANATTVKVRTPKAAMTAWEQACRERWRALFLIIKAKLEAVETGVVTMEDEFLAQTVMPSGQTVGEYARDTIPQLYAGKSVPLLPSA